VSDVLGLADARNLVTKTALADFAMLSYALIVAMLLVSKVLMRAFPLLGLPSPFLLILPFFRYDSMPPYLPMPLREFPGLPFVLARCRV